jgi:hypothetical protein
MQAYPNHPELMELQLVVCTLRHRNREDSGSDFFLTQTSSFRRSTDAREEIPREKKQKHKEILYEILPTKLDSIPSRSTKFQIQTGATTTTTAELKSTLGCSRNKQFSKIHLQIRKVLSLGPLLSSAWTRARKRI